MVPEDVKCAVCGASMSYDDAYGSVEHAGEMYQVCCRACMERFNEEPAKYAA
jgi:YHS domain-containing protein